MTVTCNQCHVEFKKPQCWVKRSTYYFCSKVCHDEFQTIRMQKICVTCNKPFEVRPSELHKFSTCSKSCQRLNRSKACNVNWRGGVSTPRKANMSTTEYKQWRLAVFERDNYTCVFCKQRGGDLNADHIKPWAFFPELRYELDNGRTLCLKCHKTTYKDNLKWKKL
jgi:hypothetical protein